MIEMYEYLLKDANMSKYLTKWKCQFCAINDCVKYIFYI